MTRKTWIGGGNDNASDAKDWSPSGIPVAGDTIDIHSGTMLIRGNDLAGNALLLDKPASNTAATTLILSHHASVSLVVPASLSEAVIVDVQGADTLHVSHQTPSDLFIDVNLAEYTTLNGNFDLMFGQLVVNGAHASSLLNNGTSNLGGNEVILETSVQGTGSFIVGNVRGSSGHLEFGGSVSRGQNVEVGANLGSKPSHVQIDHPNAYKGSVALQTNGEVDLMGLTGADSYQLKNDMLSIYSGAAVIDRLRMTLPPPLPGSTAGITVRQTSAGVAIDRGISFQTGIPLPVHQPHGSVML